MKSLALYIDKWYIIGAVSIDGIMRPVNLPNREDRIWLYFYEDAANNEISYGKGFQSKFRDNELHYYGDVFSLITRSSARYMMFNRSQPMKGIFKSSKIFDDLRNDMDEDGDIMTYISYSEDISPASRLLFEKELATERFVVKENVAHIGHLALEYAEKKSNYTEDGYYLVLNACNENLHYTLYKKTEDLFNRVEVGVLEGMGTDVRRRALIEHVVGCINEREHFLKTKEECESEYLRMNQFVDDWLGKLSSNRNDIPVQLTEVTFSRDPFKDYSVVVKKNKIDDRTDKIVRDIINAIVRFVKDAGVNHEQMRGILFLGNTFTNNRFKKELRSYYNLDDSKMVVYSDSDLASLVSAYNFMDCSQFSATQNVMRGDAEAELRRIKNAEEEADALKRAKEEADAEYEKERKAVEAERKFKDAMERGYDAEQEHDYDQMEEFFSIALTLYPDNEEARLKHEESLRRKAELSVRQNHYKERIQQAKSAYDDNDYETAKFKAEEALSFMPESKEAQRIKEDSMRRIKSQKELERYLDRADLFMAKKAYDEARQELEKARLLDVDDKGIVERLESITKEQDIVKKHILELTADLDSALNEGRYDDALKSCNELIDVDFANSRRWSMRIADINSKKEKAAEEERRWKKLLKDIDTSLLSEDWIRLVDLCKEALVIQENPEIKSKLSKAEEKITEIQKEEQFNKTMSEINELAVRKEFEEATSKLNNLERTFRKKELLDSDKEKIIRDTRKRLFDFDQGCSDVDQKKLIKPATKKAAHLDSDWNFGIHSQPQKIHHQAQKPKPPNPKSDDSFFDSDVKNRSQSKGNRTKLNGKITNDDFNF